MPSTDDQTHGRSTRRGPRARAALRPAGGALRRRSPRRSRARCTGCSGPRARARARCCACWPASWSRRRASVEVAGACVLVGDARAELAPIEAQLEPSTRFRIALARAVAGEPSVLLVDEPPGGFDSETAAAARALVTRHAARGGACVWATRRLDSLHGLASGVTLLAGRPHPLHRQRRSARAPRARRVRRALGTAARTRRVEPLEHFSGALATVSGASRVSLEDGA